MQLLPRLPPTPIRGPRPIPLLGPTGGLLRFFADPIACMRSLHARYGAIAAVSDRDPSLVCAFGAEYNRKVLSDAQLFHNWADLLFEVPKDSAPVRINQALPGMNGEVHRRQRRMMMPVFNKVNIEGLHGEIAELTGRCLERLPVGLTVDMSAEMGELTRSITLRCLYGVDASSGEEDLGRMATRYLEGLTSVGAMLLPRMIPGTPYHAFMHLAERFEGRILALIRERREKPEGRRDLLSHLIGAHDDDGSKLTEDELIGQAAVLFIAAYETTAFTLSWTLFLLSQHPRVYGDLVDELAGALRGGAAIPADFGKLPLLDGVIKESMRLLPATPFLFMRRAKGGFELGPYTLPEGATVIVSPLITHRVPEVFPGPQRFQPERWRDISPSPYEYMPFGAGPRMCIGAGFAGLVLRVALSLLVQRFRFTLAHGARISGKVQGITFGPKHGLPMLVVPQDRRFPAPGLVRGDIGELVDLDKA